MKPKTGFLLLAMLGALSAILAFAFHPFFAVGSFLSLMGALLLAQLYGDH